LLPGYLSSILLLKQLVSLFNYYCIALTFITKENEEWGEE
jgi:hypothetical protein